jgi:GT2 family glycosyltransferase
MVIPISTFDKIGLYNENLFLGAIDTEFVSRATRSGMSIYRVNKVMIVQDFGRTIKPYNLRLKIVNYFTRYYSIILMSLGKTNEYRHLLVDYSEMQSQLNYIDKLVYGKQSGAFNILDHMESLISAALRLIIIKLGGVMH